MPGAASPEQCLLAPAPPYSVALTMTFRWSQTAVPTLQLPALLELLAAGGRPLALSLRWRQDSGTFSHLNAAKCFVFEAEKMAYRVGSRAPFPPLTLWLFLHVTGKCL